MKKILSIIISLFLITPCMANIHIAPDSVAEVIAEYFPKKQTSCIEEYNTQVKASSGTGIAADKIWNICAIGGLDIKKATDKEKCQNFVTDLTRRGTIKFYEVCGKNKEIVGAVCVKDFSDLSVNLQQAEGLAKLYAYNKSDTKIQCRTKARNDVKTTTSINIHAMGMSSTTVTPYLQCTSHNSNKFYEFQFKSVDGNIDSNNHKNFKTGICKIFGSKYVTKSLRDYTFDVCEDIQDESNCNKIDKTITGANIGYVASWGALGSARLITGNAYDYCMLYEQVAKKKDGELLFEKTAFGLDGRVFLKTGAQRKGSAEIKKQIRTYVENTMGKENVKSFSCEPNYHTIKLKDRSGTDDMVKCMINGQEVDFFFDDLSESWNLYDESGREAMNCVAWGGTFTGKKCIGLDEEKCNIVKKANAESCPECKSIKWNEKTKICELPASVSATNLKRGLTYSAMIGGAAVSVAITIGTAGAGGVTVGTAIIMIVETAGAGIELTSQIIIDNKTDRFFNQSANCYSESCAKTLVYKYLEEFARMENDLSDAEADAVDKEMARLIELIPTYSDWWIYSLKNSDGTSFLEKANDGDWTPAQVWRAIGIGMQFAGILSSVTGWVIKKSGYLEKTLDRTSRILLSSARTAEKNIVKVDKLDDVGKEWYKLWQEYAPKNQTFEQFKAMTNGNLDEMKKMSKGWIPRSKKAVINAQTEKQMKQLEEIHKQKNDIFQNILAKHEIDFIPADPQAQAEMFKKYPDLEQAYKNVMYAYEEKTKFARTKEFYDSYSNYSTIDYDFARTFANQRKIDKSKEVEKVLDTEVEQYRKQADEVREEIDILREKWKKTQSQQDYENLMKKYDEHTAVYSKIDELRKKQEIEIETQKELKKALPTQWEVAEKHQLKNIGNVVNERAHQFDEIIKSNPEIQSKLDKKVWAKLSDEERSNVAQKILDEYAAKTGTPRAKFGLDYNTEYGGYYQPGTNNIFLNPNEQFKTSDGMIETLAHEHGHMIDDLTPNEGAMGEQYQYYADKIYSNKRDKGYRVAFTEQSSYKMGPGVSHEVTGTTHFSHGKEYELETAKKIVSGENLDVGIGNFDAGVSGIGVIAGTEIQILKNKYKRKEDDN